MDRIAIKYIHNTSPNPANKTLASAKSVNTIHGVVISCDSSSESFRSPWVMWPWRFDPQAYSDFMVVECGVSLWWLWWPGAGGDGGWWVWLT